MANHCMDVVCCGCGRHWCLRGCSFDHGPNPELAATAQRRLKQGKQPYVYKGETCCKGFDVVADYLIMGGD